MKSINLALGMQFIVSEVKMIMIPLLFKCNFIILLLIIKFIIVIFNNNIY